MQLTNPKIKTAGIGATAQRHLIKTVGLAGKVSLRAAQQRVVTTFAVQCVSAGAAQERVVPRVAVNGVIPIQADRYERA